MSSRLLHRGWILALPTLIGIAWSVYAPEDASTRLTFIAVGQGDCTVFQHKGHTILIDSGPRSDVSDAGVTIVVPELYRLGVRSIDTVILTHSDMDHIGGLISVARHFRIGRVVYPAACADDPDLTHVLSRARIENRVELEAHDEWQLGEVHIALDTPARTFPGSTNDSSIFTRIAMGASSVLITGDASFSAEYAMLARGRVRQSQIFHVGHHGSKSSSSEELLQIVKPEISVISVGRHNSYGHPAQSVLQRLVDSGSKIMRTDRDGTLRFVPSPKGFVREPD